MATSNAFQVNTTTANRQTMPAIASLNDGRFVVTWQSEDQDAGTFGVYARLYDANGVALGGEFLVNTTSASDQFRPAVTALADGGFAISWSSNLQDGSSYGIYGQRYASNGTATGTEFRVNTTTDNIQLYPAHAGLASGGAVIVWQSNAQDGAGYGLFAQRYAADGTTLGAEFQVNTTTAADQKDAAITALGDGGFVISWTSDGQDGSADGVVARVFDADGTARSTEIQVNSHTASFQQLPSVAALSGGGFVVTWQSWGQDGDLATDTGTYGQVFAADGSLVGSEFRIETLVAGDQATPGVSGLNNGQFVVVWETASGDQIAGQVFDADGTRAGAEFRVPTVNDTTGNPVASAHGAAGFVVAWQSGAATEDITARLFFDGAPTLADLEIANASLDAPSVSAGGSLQVSFDVLNTGETSAASSEVSLKVWDIAAGAYLQAAGIDRIFATNPTDAILPGAQDGSEVSVIGIPADLAPGQYRLDLIADHLGSVAEQDESNNLASLNFEVTPEIGNNDRTVTDAETAALIAANPFLAALGWQSVNPGDPAFEMWDGTHLTFDFHQGEANPDGEDIGLWDAELTAAYLAAFADLAAISDLTFTEVEAGADIDLWSYSHAGDGALGYSYGVGGDGVFFNRAYLNGSTGQPDNGLTYGGYDYTTIIHELLHNLGVDHPFAGFATIPGVGEIHDMGDFALNQNLYTVMSYNDVAMQDAGGRETTGWPYTLSSADQSFNVLGTFDLAYIQTLYGRNMATATGNDTYNLFAADGDGVFYKAIWDAGGTDQFRYDGTGNAVIDLRAATLDPGDGMLAGGMISAVDGVHGGFLIANGVVIENATGDQGDDILTGNDADNILVGRDGNDILSDDAGADLLKGGRGRDTLRGGRHNDELVGGDGADRLFGDERRDTISGGNGRDFIVGGKGIDVLTGGRGVDTFFFNRNSASDTITDFEQGIDRIRIRAAASDFDDLTFTTQGSATVITFASVAVIVENSVIGDWDEGDFLF